ncbi:hypothetical protein HELRODRAFT_162834 [Helobdella robusta]|uniref:SMP-LTD domain-containing protein n=1 Tax=Helobdella robusta TaxID=6412 RepID=T1ET87_HELRO|nr:hypothetical protein HELRODRAFT_162834 [Helobdella robusta]ESN99313.1 hypothetical protein HELRODRAFT_162834 [Helobdella robusta]
MDTLSSPFHETNDGLKDLKQKRQNDQMMLYIFILSMLLLSFFLGYFQFSLFWIFIIGLLTLFVWNRRALDLTERFIWEQETLLHRKRALRQNETCEWLNFLINRWFVFGVNNFSDIVKRNIDSFLINVQPYFLSSLEFKNLKIDSQTPSIQSIHAFEVEEGKQKTISWSNIMTPPPGLKMVQKHQLVLEVRMEISADQFMELTAKLSGKWLGLSFDLLIEKMNVKALVQVNIHLDRDVPFPHVASITSCFVDKPEVWFNIRVLRYIQIMEIPLLKLWLHNLIINALTEALVDPGKVEITFNNRGLMGPVLDKQPFKKLDVKNKTPSNSLELFNDTRYCTVAIDDQQSSSSPLVSGSSPFTHSATFLVYNLSTEQLKIRLKSKVLLTNQSLAHIVLPLNNYALQQKPEYVVSCFSTFILEELFWNNMQACVYEYGIYKYVFSVQLR